MHRRAPTTARPVLGLHAPVVDCSSGSARIGVCACTCTHGHYCPLNRLTRHRHRHRCKSCFILHTFSHILTQFSLSPTLLDSPFTLRCVHLLRGSTLSTSPLPDVSASSFETAMPQTRCTSTRALCPGPLAHRPLLSNQNRRDADF